MMSENVKKIAGWEHLETMYRAVKDVAKETATHILMLLQDKKYGEAVFLAKILYPTILALHHLEQFLIKIEEGDRDA